ncbi:MAG: hypothetical protein CMF50_06495 [Legionellales bacterium]|nr:hypothetical protein [Legionellales bacterium]|tara:strand:- start:4888 stop:5706 length:819 start_codon:yes stop_codon:yes gene_type:complete
MSKFTNNLKKTTDIDPCELARVYQFKAQELFAPTLRAAAIKHLAEGNGPVARGFRGEYLNVDSAGYQHFLTKQRRNRAWGTYIEATALGELTGCNVVVTPIRNGEHQSPICLYRAADSNAPTVHLYNSNNTHWFVDGSTRGDGNCLYNAFAQAFQTIARKDLPVTAFTRDESQVNQKLFSKAKQQTTIEQQRQLDQAIARAWTPDELEANLKAEQERMSKLPAAEQAQIRADYEYGLKLAGEFDSHVVSGTAIDPNKSAAAEQQRTVIMGTA